jgi:hypothetical protein
MHSSANGLRSAFVGVLLMASLLVVCITAPAGRLPNQSGDAKAAPAERTKVAQGEYVVVEAANGGAVGPFGEEIYNFHETWTLWRTAKGTYEVEGERQYEAPKEVSRSDRFVAELSRDLTITRVTEYGRLKWRRDSGPLTCEFLRTALHCSSNAKNPGQSIELNTPMAKPFGFLWPISAFSLSSVTRAAERDRNRLTRVQLVSIEQPSEQVPVMPMILDGQIRYLGEDKIDIEGQPRRAFKFSIKAMLSPELIVWTSPKGLLLRVAVRHEEKNWPEEGIKLAHFQEWAGFE